LQLSEDGENWETVWVSEDDLPVENFTEEHLCEFDKNYESRFFKIRILKTRNMNTFTHLSEFRVFRLGESSVDLEEEAEERY
ncbi:MAG: hypothetical protein R6U46_07135, partial [Marinilabilia sp.]